MKEFFKKYKTITLTMLTLIALAVLCGLLVVYLSRGNNQKTSEAKPDQMSEEEINALLFGDIKDSAVDEPPIEAHSDKISHSNSGDASANKNYGEITEDSGNAVENYYLSKEKLAELYTKDHPDENGGYYISGGNYYVDSEGFIYDMRGDEGYESDYIVGDFISFGEYTKYDPKFVEVVRETAKEVSAETGVPTGVLIAFAFNKSMQGALGTVELLNNPYLIPAKGNENGVPLTVEYYDSWAEIIKTESGDYKSYATIEDSVRDFADYIKNRIGCENPYDNADVLGALIAAGYYPKENWLEAFNAITMWQY